jgi:outer membrane protein OmpA-like peptidoglycan-associated protein
MFAQYPANRSSMSSAEMNRKNTVQSLISSVVLTAALSLSSSALAQGYPTDIEIVRPVFSEKGLPGIDTPMMSAQPTMRVGLLTQYERDPLILYQFGKELGAVVKHRSVMQLGVSYDFTPTVSTRLILPLAFHSGSDIPELDSDGVGLEDLQMGARFQLLQIGPWTTGVRADFIAQTGTKDSFHGEDGLRTGAGWLNMVELGAFSAMLDTNLMTRSKVELEEDFTLGTELAVNAGIRYWVLPDRLAVWGSEISRGGFHDLYGLKDQDGGGAENTVELLAGLEYQPNNYTTFHMGAGAGAADGYGGTKQRVIFGARFVPIPPPRPDYVVDEADEVATDPPPEIAIEQLLTVEKKWGENELARVEEEQIVIRDPIQFEYDTANILRESIPTLRFVARLMNGNARIGHVVISGHASEEGSYTYNYDLSIRRARAIWEEVIRSGVHPARLSYRGMGEVDPRRAGQSEGQLAKNRRAEFSIVKRFSPLDILPDYGEDILLPWSGKPAKVKKPEDIDLKMKQEQDKREQDKDSEGLREGGETPEPESKPAPTPAPAPEEGTDSPEDPDE